jgi:N-acetylglucosaminyldiphosphoundecaprenol N-acetyl-beta-D-mannosaminyltransferase
LSRNQVRVLGVNVDGTALDGIIRQVARLVVSGGRHYVVYANVHVLNAAFHNPELRQILNQADLVYCDGAGVRVGAWLLGSRLPKRLTGADWIHDLATACQERGFSFYFLGGEPGVAAQAAEKLQEEYLGLEICGTHHGYYDHLGPENDDVVAAINRAQPDILLVGFGTPLQETWIARNIDQLDVPVVWAVGALVDFVAGKVPRAPRFMLDHGLEWLYRLLIEPGRLWKRYIIGNPLFIWRVLMQRLGLLSLE